MQQSVDFDQSSDSFFDHSHRRDSAHLPSLKTPKKKLKAKHPAPEVNMQYLTKKDKHKLE
jgi:hypothetical protein